MPGRIISIFSVIALFSVSSVLADSFSTVALQNAGFTQVDLGAGLDPLLGPTPTSFPNGLLFDTSGPPPSPSFLATLEIAGVQMIVDQCTYTFIGSCVPGAPFIFTDCGPSAGQCVLGAAFNMPVLYQVTPGTLTVEFNGVFQTYNFQYQTPVPEPMTIVMVALGLVVLSRRVAKT